MLQLRSVMTVADNTGAKFAYLIGIPGRGNKKIASIGDIIMVVVKQADPYAQVKRGDKLPAVIVRIKKEKGRTDGSYIRFDDNACVLIQAKDNKDPKGTRVFGPVAREVKDAGFNKIASLASEIY
ncbi:50S ribosomal protein L14 [Candidatus Roizmanbacteria bacterium RIFCSPHIGHO2_02_FULL_40_13b]|uniref:Large ribosomal subunit protein uL14 n=1 Tax=Candidatus Roizmanbacteria bacterium RIFCSPHIGHO2_01_FULL_39_24 TaxID=1802032 RepID=A0A1F7GMG9_9BACT|nr:MAG: 50S ribosomal protein L14 [Candidatus Roizmanbacteria bacterium RIFCSPHIGHO2_01_FULL_39_24]OGK27811.1 MAG: 50S ribosomal protein L14 [Candidatus Roizmanbacteria bacterium RIFCSPHIGHO2_02_FULL_40_13b]OGK49953.1 MAG: 50S ribosomal protein L14 [Candidatus Roizmanbacteria bacterium RIFCSPLOWO2_01_FULL_40_32]OGK55958.1 MAG: 50S ribosomal protein L14 [Candidatus Roizmanbacteria bacterium RIFCSPLOWO2_02_FULL_39_8]